MKSLDPRINRIDVPEDIPPVQEHEYWQTYEVFHQEKRGKQHVHVGSLHAPNAEMALLFAKEQFARRKKCTNLWVVKTADVFATNLEDEDMFETIPEKIYREAGGYKVTEKIAKYKESRKV
ncbi:MAG TPA: 1,2-phenylacetyl-CoA epoxidase subunit PaaB [Chitinophagales bacterium]|nr:1,2-phenylacetyl-CoA epoxidase subunit PaaB [Chitinophagales bacterium]